MCLLTRRRKKNEERRKCIGAFDIDVRAGNGASDMEYSGSHYQGKIRPGMGVQRVLTGGTMHTRTDTSSGESTNASSPSISKGGAGDKGEAEGAREDIVDFGDTIDWIRNRDRRRDRERSRLGVGGSVGLGGQKWRYDVRINGGGNNI